MELEFKHEKESLLAYARAVYVLLEGIITGASSDRLVCIKWQWPRDSNTAVQLLIFYS